MCVRTVTGFYADNMVHNNVHKQGMGVAFIDVLFKLFSFINDTCFMVQCYVFFVYAGESPKPASYHLSL